MATRVSMRKRAAGADRVMQHGAFVDHLVVAARTLDDGVRWCEAALGITPDAGGKHPLMSTHNRLLNIASDAFPKAYFEIVAIDPDAPPPGRARWFGLDRLDLSQGPRLVSFVARTGSLNATLAALRDAGFDGGRPLAASRQTPSGPLRWRIAVRDDGAVLCDGAMPTLIEWGERHPAASMPPSGVALRSLVLRGLPHATLDVAQVTFADTPGPALEAHLDTPRGIITLRSS